YEMSDLLVDSSPLLDTMAIIIDGSLGSTNGTLVSDSFIDMLIRYDRPVILVGRSAWLLHRLRDIGPPLLTAPVSQHIFATPAFSGAVFLSMPHSIQNGATLTIESLTLPLDRTQTEKSRIVLLTEGDSGSYIQPLRYESWPLDAFLIGIEDPTKWTVQGKYLFINTVAYSTSLSESTTTSTVSGLQSDGPLAGGMEYFHEPTLESAYDAIQSVKLSSNTSEWNTWVSDHSTTILDLLNSLYVDEGAESGFRDTVSSGTVSLRSTARGLWILGEMGLTSYFSVSEVRTYIVARQDPDGGFEYNLETTYLAVQALAVSGSLSSINTVSLEDWIRDCVITFSETSDPDRWGAIGSNPTSISPKNSLAAMFLLSLDILGTTHNDPVKLSTWINTRTSNGDGSYDNSLTDGSEIILGTASAVLSLEMMGQLSSQNRTSSLTWLAANQLPSGGFGFDIASSDIIGKTDETASVALCLDILGISDDPLTAGIVGFVDAITTPIGFEGMEVTPTLMWTNWLGEVSRFTHSGSYVDIDALESYLGMFSAWTQYPQWNNLTAYISPEYGINQYRTWSIWTQYFGIEINEAFGISLTGDAIGETVSYISQCQAATGHYRPTILFGTEHMQYSVAAVETLYLINSLNTIQYRANLESAILNSYSSGSWDTTGWTLQPFVQSQAAMEWAITRAALRLGILDSTMASEIASVISARIQYTNLWDLSRDVATLALLNSSFSVNLSMIDNQQVLAALGSSPFSTGWYNSSTLWQPVFTSGVMEMISILGLRPEIVSTEGSSMVATSSPSVNVGGTLDLFITITSPVPTHTVYVNAFNKWTRFDNVVSIDTLSLDIPNDYSVLGPHNISLMVWNYNESRSFGLVVSTVQGSLSGTLQIETPTVLLGDLVNGTVSWALISGGDAGTSQVIVRLSDESYFEQWNYTSTSPMDFSIPSDGFTSGPHNLTVYINQTYCDVLILQEGLWIQAPDMTYISANSHLEGVVGTSTSIPCSLHFLENDSIIAGQTLTLNILDETEQVVFSDALVSSLSLGQFSWTPSNRGNYTFTISFDRNGTLESCIINGTLDIFEATEIVWQTTGIMDQYDTILITAYLSTESGASLSGYSLSINVISPTSILIYDSTLVTNSTGQVSFYLLLSENGNYSLEAEFIDSGLLLGTTQNSVIVSWSSTEFALGGITADGLVNTTWNIWISLFDSNSIPIVGESVDIQILYLPSTIVHQTSLTTNSTGGGSFQWTASSPGSYQISAIFAGSASRQAAQDSIVSNLRIPVTLSFSGSSTFKVGTLGWSLVQALDHSGGGISGLTVMFVVRNPSGIIVFQTTDIVTSGLVNISWTPTDRGLNNITISTSRTILYESGYCSIFTDVYETPIIGITLDGDAVSPSITSITISVTDSVANPLPGIQVNTIAILEGVILFNYINTTLPDGTVTIPITLENPGLLEISSSINPQVWLYSSNSNQDFVIFGLTYLTIDSNGLPVDQTTSVGFQSLLLNWESSPIQGASVTYTVESSNGSIIIQSVRVTGVDGTSAFAYTFNDVGDYIVRAGYLGEYLNASCTTQIVQRVVVKPDLILYNSPTCFVDDSTDIQIGIMDALEHWMIGLDLHLVIMMNGSILYDGYTTSVSGLSNIPWTPPQRGVATIILSYAGDSYVLANSTQNTLSVLEQVSAMLSLSPVAIDLGNSSEFTYKLQDTLDVDGVEIQFEVLDSNLVPIWSTIISTNSSGYAKAIFTATNIIGVLTVYVAPVDQQLIGGEVQNQLVVMTGCTTTISLEPSPASIGGSVNITIMCLDDLGGSIDGLSIRISLFYLGQPIRLGLFTDWITKTTVNGNAWVEFSPEYAGSYQIIVESSGSVGVHSFYTEEYHIVHNPTTLEFVTIISDLEVGDELHVVALLTNYFGDPLVGRTVTLTLDTLAGPVDLITNATGHVDWNAQVNQEGLWEVRAEFNGVGVYLPSSKVTSVDVRYGTRIIATRIDNSTIIAGLTSLSVAVLLEDTGGTALEGRMILYQVYHDSQGLLFENSFVQIGQTAELVNISLDRFGDHTILFSFAGTVHYHPSSTALSIFVVGTSEISMDGVTSSDRSERKNVTITLYDELGIKLNPSELLISLSTNGDILNLQSRLWILSLEINLNLTGLQVGQYLLNVTLLTTSNRVGTNSLLSFNVTASSILELSSSDISGLVGQMHSASFHLIDSLTESIADAFIYVSIYDPDGSEVFGSLLTTRTLIVMTGGYADIEWTPSKTGNYTVFIQYEGNDFIRQSNLTITILTRYETHMDVTLPDRVVFPASGRLMVTLSGGLGKVSYAEVTIQLQLEGIIIQELFLETDVRGLAQIDLAPPYAGNYSILISYHGSERYA
ncbi:MAG: hypothetical protein ACFFF4_14070, partial [Candidatus Thorarchaeota archaeon]